MCWGNWSKLKLCNTFELPCSNGTYFWLTLYQCVGRGTESLTHPVAMCEANGTKYHADEMGEKGFKWIHHHLFKKWVGLFSQPNKKMFTFVMGNLAREFPNARTPLPLCPPPLCFLSLFPFISIPLKSPFTLFLACQNFNLFLIISVLDLFLYSHPFIHQKLHTHWSTGYLSISPTIIVFICFLLLYSIAFFPPSAPIWPMKCYFLLF